jgi:translation initiation factor 3 subunit D
LVYFQNEERYKFPNPNPFIQTDEENEAASVAYRYRSWDLGNNQIIVIRCEQDCVQIGPNGEEQFVNIKAINEWNSKVLKYKPKNYHKTLNYFLDR